jgi:hypothetical protein
MVGPPAVSQRIQNLLEFGSLVLVVQPTLFYQDLKEVGAAGLHLASIWTTCMQRVLFIPPCTLLFFVDTIFLELFLVIFKATHFSLINLCEREVIGVCPVTIRPSCGTLFVATSNARTPNEYTSVF